MEAPGEYCTYIVHRRHSAKSFKKVLSNANDTLYDEMSDFDFDLNLFVVVKVW